MANKRPWESNSKVSTSGWGSDLPPHLKALREVPAEINFARISEVSVLVSVQNADLADFSERVFDEIEAKLIAAGGEMPAEITKEELTKYFATAIYSRVMWVNRTMRPNSFRPDDRWALPAIMSYVVSAIGRVETEDGPTYVPEWDSVGDDLLLSKAQWEVLTRRLRALEPYGLRFAKALEKETTGVGEVMSLLHLETPEGDYFYANIPPHAFECLCALIAGLHRGSPVQLPDHPDLLPKYRLNGAWVLRWRHDFAQISSHRDAVLCDDPK